MTSSEPGPPPVTPDATPDAAPRITVTRDGPYRVEGRVAVTDAEGRPRTEDGVWHLCRCGGSRTKPFCDATHGLKGFDGQENAEHAGPVDSVDPSGPASVEARPDGPYDVRGAVELIGADGRAYERRGRRSLCRCGQSATKPFCDGSHADAGFRDPLPDEPAQRVPTVYEWLGGLEALERLTTRFYADIVGDPDPLLEPVFRGMSADHPAHVAAWLAETFGGPRLYTEEHGGYEHMVAQHLGRALTEQQRQRWVSRLLATADLVGLPDDPDVRSALVGYLEWGSRIAVHNSAPGASIIEHAPVPRWGWGNSAPYVAQPWDAPEEG